MKFDYLQKKKHIETIILFPKFTNYTGDMLKIKIKNFL